eukprot:scaffold48946_cov63-Cyclotella_meneghiniana.AAC.9
MLQSASNVTSVSEGDAIAVAIDLRLQFSADTTKHLASKRCTKLQIPLHSMSLPETALFALTSMVNQIQFSSHWYDSQYHHDSIGLIIFESRQPRDLPESILATEKLTLSLRHLTNEDYESTSTDSTSSSTSNNESSHSDENGGLLGTGPFPFVYEERSSHGTAGHHFCIFDHSFDDAPRSVPMELNTHFEAEETTASPSFAIAQNGGLIFSDLFFSVAAFVQNCFGIDVNGGATILSFRDLVGNWSTREESQLDLHLAHESISLLSPTLVAGARANSKTLSSTKEVIRDEASHYFKSIKVPYFPASTKTTTLCEGDVQATLVKTLREISRSNECARAIGSNSTGSGSDNLQLDKCNGDSTVIWFMQQFEHYIDMIYELQFKQQETSLTPDGVHSFSAASPSSIQQQHNLDLATISEGDAMILDKENCRNLRQSSVLVMCEIYSQMDLQNKNDLPSLPSSCVRSVICNIDAGSISEGDLLDSDGCRNLSSSILEATGMTYMQMKVRSLRIEEDKANQCIPFTAVTIVSEGDLLLFEATTIVSEGDLLLLEATQAFSVRLFQKSYKSFITNYIFVFGNERRSSISSSFPCYASERDRYKLQLAEQIQRNVIFDCKQLQQKSWQSESTIANESIRKHIESTVMVDTTIIFLMHRSSAATQQSTVSSIAYLLNQSNQQAASIDVSTQRNSCHGFDGWPIVMQVQVLVLALVMYAFACTFATTRYFLSTSFVLLHRSLKQHVNKKIFYRSHTRFKACSYTRESRRIFSPQQSNHFSLNLHFTRESENISIRSISNIYSDQFRIYLKFRYKVFI